MPRPRPSRSTTTPRTVGAQQLIDWLDRTGTSQASFARAIGLSTGHLGTLLSGRPERARPLRPSLAVAHEIEQRTGIPMEAWLSRVPPVLVRVGMREVLEG
jgi:transcriptional regulator with XRE-family HTH domain